METLIENTYRTCDLNLISFLITENCTISKIDKLGNRAFIYFLNREKCESLAQDFWNGKAKVSARSYADSLRRAKDLIFAEVGR